MRPAIAAVALAIAVMAVAVPVAAIDSPCGSNPTEAKVVRGPAGPRGPQGPVGPPGAAAEIPWWIIALAALGAASGLVGMGAALGHHPAAVPPVVINNVVPPHGQPPATP